MMIGRNAIATAAWVLVGITAIAAQSPIPEQDNDTVNWAETHSA
jgi:hypothetical protein